jgi:hypothetical protein
MQDPPQPRVNEQLPKTEQLVAAVTRTGLGASPVPVPSRVRNHHEAACGFRDQTYVHEISRKALPRAVRIVHGFANEINRRGHRIVCVSGPVGGYGRSDWKAKQDGQFVITINGHDFKLRLCEKGVGLRGPWEGHKKQREEDRQALRFHAWDAARIEPYDKHATGQLDLVILTYSSRQTRWGDRKRWSLEDRLPRVSAPRPRRNKRESAPLPPTR